MEGKMNCSAPFRGTGFRHKLLVHNEIKSPAPPEGAGHSQGERRLLLDDEKGVGQWLPIASPSMPGLAEFLGSMR